jgi:uncharacterized protein (DUF3084 family)
MEWFGPLITIMGTAASVGGIVLFVFNGTKKIIRESHILLKGIEEEIKMMREEIKGVRAEIKTMREEIKAMREENKKEFKAIREEMRQNHRDSLRILEKLTNLIEMNISFKNNKSKRRR